MRQTRTSMVASAFPSPGYAVEGFAPMGEFFVQTGPLA
jgi:hypothetical protein